MVLKNATILTQQFIFSKLDIQINKQLISKISLNIMDNNIVNLEDKIIVPGLIDIHTHGMGGYDFTQNTTQSLKKLSELYALAGTTSFIATSPTVEISKLSKVFSDTAKACSDLSGANLLGIHMEGPYLAKAKAGAHDTNLLKNPSVKEVESLNKDANGLLKIISFAPELKGSMDFIKSLTNNYILSIAHSNANFETACKAINLGATHITHFYNAMTEFNHRNPGVVGAVLDSDINLDVELITEKNHLHIAAIRLAFKIIGTDNIIIISDSIPATGLPDGKHTISGLPGQIRNGAATLLDGTIAGSTNTLLQNVQYAIFCGIKPENAFKAATMNPAKTLGVSQQLGSIKCGKFADLLILNKDFSIYNIMLKGKFLYANT